MFKLIYYVLRGLIMAPFTKKAKPDLLSKFAPEKVATLNSYFDRNLDELVAIAETVSIEAAVHRMLTDIPDLLNPGTYEPAHYILNAKLIDSPWSGRQLAKYAAFVVRRINSRLGTK